MDFKVVGLYASFVRFLIAVVVLRVLPGEIVTRSVSVSLPHWTVSLSVLSAVVSSQGLKNVFQILRTLFLDLQLDRTILGL